MAWTRDRSRLLGIVVLGAAAQAGSRWLAVASTTHLVHPLARAEYGYLGALERVRELSWMALWLDSSARMALQQACAAVVDEVHGTSWLTGLLLVAGERGVGLPPGTVLLKATAVGISVATLLLWQAALWRSVSAERRVTVATVFTLLFVLGGPAWTLLNTTLWGTHEVAGLLSAAMVAVVLPWFQRPVSLARMTAAGALFGLMAVANHSLLLPAAGLGLGLVCAAAHHARGQGTGARPLRVALTRGGVGLGALVVTVQLVLASGFLAGAGLSSSLSADHLLGLTSSGGGPLLSWTGQSVTSAHRWAVEVWPNMLAWMPGQAGGGLDAWVRAGTLACTAVVGLGSLWGMRRASADPDAGLGAFLGLYTLGACVALGVLMLGFVPGAAVVDGAPNSVRFFTHLYPMLFAALAVGIATRGRRAQLVGVGVLSAVGLFAQVQTVDLHNLAALSRYDGATLYWHATEPTHPVSDALPLSSASADFRAGVALVSQYQSGSMWSARTPVALAAMPHQRTVERFIARHQPEPGPRRDAFVQGVGYACRILLPPARRDRFDEIVAALPEEREMLMAGYERVPPG